MSDKLKPNEELLTIKQAARLLNVSEMSLRRWTNAGRLNCYRVGPKKERRFRILDLEAFLGDISPRHQEFHLGFSDFQVPAHAHVSQFYRQVGDSIATGAAYLCKGLELDEVVLAMSPHGLRDRLLAAIEEAGFPVFALMEQGRLQVIEGMEDPSTQAGLVDQFMERAQRESTTFRLLGNMIWIREKGWDLERLYALEKETNLQRENCPSLFLCQYDITRFSADVAFMAMQTHNFTIYNNRLNQSPYFELAEGWSPSNQKGVL